jgi:hypothetical protein
VSVEFLEEVMDSVETAQPISRNFDPDLSAHALQASPNPYLARKISRSEAK